MNKTRKELEEPLTGQGIQTCEPLSLLDKIRQEKAKVSRIYNSRIKQLTRVEQLLVNSEAESIITEATEVLGE